MKLKIWDLSREENDRLWFNDEVKSVGIDTDGRLYFENKEGIYIPLILLKNGTDVFEIEE